MSGRRQAGSGAAPHGGVGSVLQLRNAGGGGCKARPVSSAGAWAVVEDPREAIRHVRARRVQTAVRLQAGSALFRVNIEASFISSPMKGT